MELIAGNTNSVSEFDLRTFAETWVEPVLKQLLKLEQYYETDEHVMAFAGIGSESEEEAPIDFGQDEVMDELLKQNVLLKVNVGMNATDPVGRVQNLLYGIGSLSQFPQMEGMFNVEEVAKEVFAQLGYKDGSRFLMPTDEEDPQVTELQAQIEQMGQMLETDQVKMQGRLTIEEMKAEATLRAAQLRSQTELQKAIIGTQVDSGRLNVQRNEANTKQQDADTRRAELMLQRDALLNQVIDQEIERRMVEDKDNVSKVGTMARDKYNKIPYEVG
jgi:hypothetical protein